LNCLVSFFPIEYQIFTDENFDKFKTEIDELLNNNQGTFIDSPGGGGPVADHDEGLGVVDDGSQTGRRKRLKSKKSRSRRGKKSKRIVKMLKKKSKNKKIKKY